MSLGAGYQTGLFLLSWDRSQNLKAGHDPPFGMKAPRYHPEKFTTKSKQHTPGYHLPKPPPG